MPFEHDSDSHFVRRPNVCCWEASSSFIIYALPLLSLGDTLLRKFRVSGVGLRALVVLVLVVLVVGVGGVGSVGGGGAVKR